MAQNGDINEKFGIYKSVCCDAEIVIAEGKKFPECPRHPNRTTEWTIVIEPQESAIDPRSSKTRKLRDNGP